MNVGWSLTFTALMALSGCASETVLRVPDSAPVRMDVMWVRVDAASMASHCRQNTLAMPAGIAAVACAVALPASGRCTIYTTRDVTAETVGHEVAHCYLGAWHN